VSSHKPPRGNRGLVIQTNWSAIIGSTGGIPKSRQNTAAKSDSLFSKFMLSQAIQSYHNLPLPPGGFIVCPGTGQSFHDLVRYHNHTKEVVHTRYVDAVKNLVPITEPVFDCDLWHTSVVGATEWGNHYKSRAHRAAADWLRRIEFRSRYVGLPENFRHPFLKTWDVEIPETNNYFVSVDEWEKVNSLSHQKQLLSLLLVSLTTTICRVRIPLDIRTILLALRWQTHPIIKSK
jgi:hypothetical protein